MEKISAAYAMDWSIELEKALRCNNTDRQIEAISRIGSRLQQWSSEPTTTPAVSDMYGLVPGEDRLFANTILLRIADAFLNGNNRIRRSILRIFLMESKQIMKKGRNYGGILAKERVPNYVEMLKRAKTVFDTGNAEAKALALRLLGCWVDLGKDSVSIQYMILSSLQSSIVSEVKAALFAAGCFCRLSQDFACIVLEILVGSVLLPETSYDVKLAAVRVFGKMPCSSSIANRAYEVGKMLMPRLQEDELKAEMLSSLSKLAFGSSILSPQLAEFLLSFISDPSASTVWIRSLKCLYFLFGGGACCFPIMKMVLATFLNIIDDKDLSPDFRCEVLRVLHKLFSCFLPALPCLDMPDFPSIVRVLRSAARSSFMAERCLALYLLVDILTSLKSTIREHWTSFPEKWEMDFLECQSLSDHKDGLALLVFDTILLIINAMNTIVKQMLVVSCVYLPEAKQGFTNLLSLLLKLVVEYPSSAHIVLDRLRCLIQTMVIACDTFNMVVADCCQELSRAEIDEEKNEAALRPCGHDEEKKTSIVSELTRCIYRFSIACINILDESCSFGSEVYHIVKSLVKFIMHNRSCSCDAYAIFSLDIHADVIFNSCKKIPDDMHDSKESKVCIKSGFSHYVFWVQQEMYTLGFIKQMFREKNYWEAYRAGIYACSKGAWFAAAFTFKRLMDGLQSELCGFWVRSLMLLAGAESEIKLILFPKVGIEMINKMHTENGCEKTFSSVEREMEYGGGDDSLRGCKGMFAKIYSRICSSQEILASSRATDDVYYFQIWFLSLRSKVLEIIIDMLELLDSHALNEEQLNKDLEGNAKLHFMPVLQTLSYRTSEFAKLSHSLNNVSKEYDLFAASFMDIDCRSFMNISRQALSCSMLAFCAFFALCFLSSPCYVSSLSSNAANMVEVTQATIVKDLIERLWSQDEKFALGLQKLMPARGEVVNTLQSRTETKSFMFIDRASILVYEGFIVDILRIQEDSNGVKDEEGLYRLHLQGIQLLSGIIKRWIEIPCLVPKYFFRIRPCVGAELFIFDTVSKNPTEFSVRPGSQLSLNLCIQLKTASRVPHGDVSKIYCILAVRSSYNIITADGKPDQARWRFQACETDEMVELFDMLLHHVRTDDMKSSRGHCKVGDGLVTAFVCFEPNQMGLGFSTCLLDVSALPEGSYQIKWQSCCIDRKGHHWSLLPLNYGSLFTIKKS